MLTMRLTRYSQLGAKPFEGDAVTISVNDTVAGLRPSAVSPFGGSKHLHMGHNDVWKQPQCHISS